MDLQQPAPSPLSGETRFIYPRATAGKRFLNSLIDSVASYALLFGIGFCFGYAALYYAPVAKFIESAYFYVVVYGIFLGYFFVMELLLGRTLGKILTNTLVLTLDDLKPSWKQILGRTLCRLIPFEAFSFLGVNASGWHDTIP
ncbi:MAG: RDD family protein, partial [Verrucomicrobia bacterium]|nr:RDD family protein [Verrucomicrobiota bacterium]